MQFTRRLLQHNLHLTLFTRKNCSLCDDAKGVLSRVWDRRPFEYKEIDVMASGYQKWKNLYEYDAPGVSAIRRAGSVRVRCRLRSLMPNQVFCRCPGNPFSTLLLDPLLPLLLLLPPPLPGLPNCVSPWASRAVLSPRLWSWVPRSVDRLLSDAPLEFRELTESALALPRAGFVPPALPAL